MSILLFFNFPIAATRQPFAPFLHRRSFSGTCQLLLTEHCSKFSIHCFGTGLISQLRDERDPEGSRSIPDLLVLLEFAIAMKEIDQESHK